VIIHGTLLDYMNVLMFE